MSYFANASETFSTDPPHLTRFIANVSLGGFSFVFTLLAGLLVILRAKHLPLRAHGIYFQLIKLFGALWVITFVIVIIPATRLILGVCFI